MSTQSITIDLPQEIFDRIEQAASKNRRPINDLLVEAVSAVAPVIGASSQELQAALAQMSLMNDAALWQAARTTMSREQRERMAFLHETAQREKLTQEESEEEEALIQLYRETLLVRAQAAVLLAQRNYDVSDPTQFHSEPF